MEVDTSQGGIPFVVACPANAIGEYVTLLLVQSARYLTIAELEVYHRQGAQSAAREQSVGMATLSSGGGGSTASGAGAPAAYELPDSPIWVAPVDDAASSGEIDEVLATSRSLTQGVHALIGLVAVTLLVLLIVAYHVRHQRKILQEYSAKAPLSSTWQRSAATPSPPYLKGADPDGDRRGSVGSKQARPSLSSRKTGSTGLAGVSPEMLALSPARGEAELYNDATYNDLPEESYISVGDRSRGTSFGAHISPTDISPTDGEPMTSIREREQP